MQEMWRAHVGGDGKGAQGVCLVESLIVASGDLCRRAGAGRVRSCSVCSRVPLLSVPGVLCPCVHNILLLQACTTSVEAIINDGRID